MVSNRIDPLIQQWKQKTWDKQDMQFAKDGDKFVLTQTNVRYIALDDIKEEMSMVLAMQSQMTEQKAKLIEQAEQMRAYLADEYDKIAAQFDIDMETLDNLHKQQAEYGSPFYDEKVKEIVAWVNKFKVDRGYSRADRYGKIEIREKSLAAAADEFELQCMQHPMLVEVRNKCYE